MQKIAGKSHKEAYWMSFKKDFVSFDARIYITKGKETETRLEK